MELTVATNWDEELIVNLRKYNISSFFGVMDKTPVGAGRPGFLLPNVSKDFVKSYVEKLHSEGLKFHYLLNAPCMNNMEYDRNVNNQLIKHIEWLNNINVDGVTVTIPLIIEIVKDEFPGLEVNVSVINHVNSVQRALMFEEFGVDNITLDFNINRDFKLLKSIRKAVKCKLTLLLNDGCLYQCPFRYYHYNIIGHASQTINPLGGFYFDYCIMRCTMKRYNNLPEYLKGRWIRPEDLKLYEDIGFENFKISGRRMSTSWLTNTVDAYHSRRYDGNLADLLNISQLGVDEDIRSPQYQAFIKQGKMIKGEKICQIGQMYPVKPYIDNSKLDGFIDFFNEKDCLSGCSTCKYCEKWADKTVKIDQNAVDKYVAAISVLLDDLKTGRVFKEDKEIFEIKWKDEIKNLIEDIIKNSTPDEFKDIALTTITKLAENNAMDRGAESVEKEDMIKAFISGTPDAFQNDMREELKNRGFNIEKYKQLI